ncbi:ribonuclease P protein component [Candidatus Mesenet endosymbiont of Phosphuga atrata]|uniref:ribonuclease P protein component n=1 Tax=Candidatus Mesenet endosymbiont of Phosphuga atrata TaxID=3066221 RepID=UPI0039776274
MLKNAKFYAHEKVTYHKKKDFLFALKNYLFANSNYLSLRVIKESKVDYSNTARVGFIVSRKSGNAVQRNKIKRYFRIISRNIIIQNAKCGYYYILLANKNSIKANLQILKKDLIFCLNKLKMHI